MVNIATTAAGAIPPSANKVVLESHLSIAAREFRYQRIRLLRDSIESGQYYVCASDLADAILRSARQAN